MNKQTQCHHASGMPCIGHPVPSQETVEDTGEDRARGCDHCKSVVKPCTHKTGFLKHAVEGCDSCALKTHEAFSIQKMNKQAYTCECHQYKWTEKFVCVTCKHGVLSQEIVEDTGEDGVEDFVHTQPNKSTNVKCFTEEQLLYHDKEVREQERERLIEKFDKAIDKDFTKALADNLESCMGERYCKVCGINPEKQRSYILELLQDNKPEE